jgi:hypothetical protein
MWVNQWVVGFSNPQAAAQFTAQALARHMWDTQHGEAGQSTAQQKTQTQQQQQECQADGSACQALSAAAAAAGSVQQGSMPSIPRTVTVLWYPEDYPAVTNHRALVTMLEDLTEPYGFKVRDSQTTKSATTLLQMLTVATGFTAIQMVLLLLVL